MPKHSTRKRAMRSRGDRLNSGGSSPSRRCMTLPPADTELSPYWMETLKITFDALPNTFFDELSPKDKETYDWVDENMRALIQNGVVPDQPTRERLIEKLESLSDRYPHVPRLFNLLGTLLAIDSTAEERKQRIIEGFERFPNYIFAFCNYIELLTSLNRLEEVERVIAGRYSLNRFCPDRDLFHASEVLTWHFTIGSVMCAQGRLDVAKVYVGILEQVRPNDKRAVYLRERIKVAEFRNKHASGFKKLFGFARS